MLRFRSTVLFASMMLLLGQSAYAKENITNSNKTDNSSKKAIRSRAAGCTPPTSAFDLAVNNVRARLMNGGDMWWDFNNALYEVPKGSGKSSLFAGAIWIGGIDGGGQLKVAAQTYRQSGSDFFAGPLASDGTITSEECNEWDLHFEVTRTEIDAFKDEFARNGSVEGIASKYPGIYNWPARNNPNTTKVTVGPRNLAAFHDEDGDGSYDPSKGDYPKLDLSGGNCAEANVNPDQMVYWVYNDKGNIHGETGAEAIGLEIQATAFAFATNDEINDMTFYRYKVTNKSNIVLNNTYMAQWIDADLGAYNDDFVGCDTTRSLGICYNGDAVDGPTSPNYGDQPPLVGIDFFEGPKDTAGNELGMAVFLYYNNDFTITGNPETAPHYYGYISGTWKDGTPFTAGGNGYGGEVASNYMFPSDPSDQSGTAWSECSEGNTPADRRLLESAGPFTLLPGAVNNVTIGAVWVQPKNVYPCPTFKSIQTADDKAQSLFDNCFKLLEGPKAPTVEIRELDQEIILTLTNTKETESYKEKDPAIIALALTDSTITDTNYVFQGYVVYQLANASVSASQLTDRSVARIVASVDIKDGIGSLVNYGFDSELNYNIPYIKAEAAEDNGIRHTFRITEDLFATGAKELVNQKSYYYTVVPYGYNNYRTYDPNTAEGITGQKVPYIESRVFKISPSYVAIPHKNNVSGIGANTVWGAGPEIIRIEGSGNGGNSLELTAASEARVLANGVDDSATYMSGNAPIEVRVFDPMKIKEETYTLHVLDTAVTTGAMDSSSYWVLINSAGDTVAVADTTIGNGYEQVVEEEGLIIKLTQTEAIGWLDTLGNGSAMEPLHGVISTEVEFSDDGNRWLTGVQDGDGLSAFNWIRAGQYIAPGGSGITGYDDKKDGSNADYSNWLDPDGQFEKFFEGTGLEGTWAPAGVVNHTFSGVAGTGQDPDLLLAPMGKSTETIRSCPSVDIVFTTDKSKWTVVPVLETQDEDELSQGGIRRLRMKGEKGYASKNGEIFETAIGNIGVSFFPGYAINVETGERMHMMFGEDSWLSGENGHDMLWNPTSNLRVGSPWGGTANYKYGGKHFIYVFDEKYDLTGDFWIDLMFDLEDGDELSLQQWEKVAYVGVPMLEEGFEYKSVADGLIPNDIRLKIRVKQPLTREIFNGSATGNNVYSFSTDALAPVVYSAEKMDTILDSVNIVPNPYLAYSEYETSQLDNTVKITNLPDSCVVSIYSLNGSLIRKYDRSVSPDDNGNTVTSLEWDLKNHKNIPISSGFYMIHIDAGENRVRTIKWFGVMRPQDLDSF